MTEAQLRRKIVGVMRDWIGRRESDGSHRHIIDTYNSLSPLPRGYRMTCKDAWCAATISAAAIECGFTDIIPRECSCNYMIAIFQKMGRWQESDAYKPQPGDIIFYDWNDSGKGDCTGAADHVGMVETVSGTTITVIEGNYNDSVRRRTLSVDGRYIRGYGVPDYASLATPELVSGVLKTGDTVRFTGDKQYATSYDGTASVRARPCEATITLIRQGQTHPYHVEGPSVEGWVDAADVEDLGYPVQVRVQSFLAVRSGPGISYPMTDKLGDGTLVTIVETQGNWGRLKSGAGWICLDYTRRV